MNEIKRYKEQYDRVADDTKLVPDNAGGWVRYTDHLAEVERLRAELAHFKREQKYWYDRYQEVCRRRSVLDKQYAAPLLAPEDEIEDKQP